LGATGAEFSLEGRGPLATAPERGGKKFIKADVIIVWPLS